MHAREGDDANNEGWDHPLAPALQRANFARVNLETPGEMDFNARVALLGALKRVGADIATFANNPRLDQHVALGTHLDRPDETTIEAVLARLRE